MVRITVGGGSAKKSYHTYFSEKCERERRALKVAKYFVGKEGRTFRACFLARRSLKYKLEY